MAISSCFRYHLLKNIYSKRKPKPLDVGVNGFLDLQCLALDILGTTTNGHPVYNFMHILTVRCFCFWLLEPYSKSQAGSPIIFYNISLQFSPIAKAHAKSFVVKPKTKFRFLTDKMHPFNCTTLEVKLSKSTVPAYFLLTQPYFLNNTALRAKHIS